MEARLQAEYALSSRNIDEFNKLRLYETMASTVNASHLVNKFKRVNVQEQLNFGVNGVG